ncbi:MAG TPA: FMN-binding protein [Anaerolineales bacterium]|nr:FMN-binding protein [Anaerolineales bacterium]
MSRSRSSSSLDLNQAVKKFFLSAFVVFAFVAYAIHERLTNSSSASAAADQGAPGSSANAAASDPASSNPAPNSSSSGGAASASSSQAPAASSASSNASGYRDGTYTGPTIDVNYGLVQVQTTIQNGRIADVQFLQYPSDRRTSQRINSIAMPYLQQEAIQVQSANVDIISGATLTSEGFQMSLQSALASAH